MDATPEFYSSTSSDDQSSINSVIHVEIAGDTTESDSAASAPPTPKRHRHGGLVEEGEAGRPARAEERRIVDLRNHSALNGDLEDDTTSDSDCDEDNLLRRDRGRSSDSESSTSSEETQIWVPAKPTLTPRPPVPSKPGYRHSANLSGCVTPGVTPAPRQSVVSHNNLTGRIETSLIGGEDSCVNADSGISNESPETHSSGENVPHLPQHSGHHQVYHHSPNSTMPTSPVSPSSSENHHCYAAITTHSTPMPYPHHHQVLMSSTPPHSSSCRSSPHPHPAHTAAASHLSSPISCMAASPAHSQALAMHHLQGSPAPSPQSQTQGHDQEDPQEINRMHADCRESLFNIVSGIYAMVLIVLGVTLPLAQICAHDLHTIIFEGYYIYLFMLSILFLLYVYVFLLRSRTTTRFPRHTRQPTSDNILLKSPARRKVTMATSSSHTGSFYLRLGAVVFGIGAMIHEGLRFGMLFEMDIGAGCVEIAEAIRPVVQLVFTFIQLYFIFLNSKMCIHRYRIFARFGLMHMIATNICVWLRTVAVETVRELNQHAPGHRSNYHTHLGSNKTSTTTTTTTTTQLPPVVYFEMDTSSEGSGYNTLNSSLTVIGGVDTDHGIRNDCPEVQIMGTVVQSASPYLYPCTIQYSLIATGILFVMWRNIGGLHPHHHLESLNTDSDDYCGKRQRTGVDCSGAHRGLFFGIFTFVAVVICTIVFFVLVERPRLVRSAVAVLHISEAALYFLALLAVIVASWRLRGTRFHRRPDGALDEALQLLSLAGVYMYCVLSAVAARFADNYEAAALVMTTSILILVQATMQAIFILNGLRRSPRTLRQERNKPGRECITFLLVCNVAMWGVSTFEVLRSDSNPVAVHFYGVIPWSIVTHICTPLAIFYRFHSTVCLASIWKNAYKLKAI